MASESYSDEDSLSLSGWSSVNYDSDEEPEDKPQELQLDWRGDPRRTNSDWTIQVVTEESEAIVLYHVHKYAVAFGSRRSESLQVLFSYAKDDPSAKVELDFLRANLNCRSNTIRLELPTLAAQVFPTVLDYIYKPENDLVISTNTATALHFLGIHMGIQKLKWEARQFWKNDLCIENSGTYYEHAQILENAKVLEAVKEVLADKTLDIQSGSKIVRVSDCKLWIDVLELVHARGGEDLDQKVKFLSEIIAEFADKNMYYIGAKGFHQLTKEENLTAISYKAALALMETKEILGGTVKEMLASKGSASHLQDRCTTALAIHWRDIHHNFDDVEWRRLEERPKGFQQELYKKTLQRCSEEKEANDQILIRVVEKCARINDAAANELKRLHAELEATKAKLDKANAELKLFQPVVEKKSIRQQGRSRFFGRKSVQPYCAVKGQQVYYKASEC